MNKVIAVIALEQSIYSINTGKRTKRYHYKILVACKFPNVSNEVLRIVYDNGNITNDLWASRAIKDLLNNNILVKNNGQYEFTEQFKNVIKNWKKGKKFHGFSISCVKSIEERLHELTIERKQFHLV